MLQIPGHPEESATLPSDVLQYVQSVLGASDQYGPTTSISYTAVNIIGRPTNFPTYGEHIDSYMLTTHGNWWREAPSFHPEFGLKNVPESKNPPVHDFLAVEFEHAVVPRMIGIYETFNPGSIQRIWAFTCAKRWVMLWDEPFGANDSDPTDLTSRLFYPQIRNIRFHVRVLRLEFNTSDLAYFPALDGILMVGSRSLSCTSEAPASCAALESDAPVPPPGTINLTQLPNEILFGIFSFLDIPSLSAVEIVCQKFNAVARDSRLYRVVNLRPYWMEVDCKRIRWLETRCTGIRKLDLSWCGMLTDLHARDVIRLLKACGDTITHLRLDDMGLEFADDEVCCIPTLCPNLREVSLRQMTMTLNPALLHFRNLTRLNLARTTVDTECLLDLLPRNPCLQHLNLSCCMNLAPQAIASTVSVHNRELISLNLWKTEFISPSAVRALQACTKLRELNIGWTTNGTTSLDGALGDLLKGCPNMETLFLTGFRCLQDADLACIAEHGLQLVQLDIMGCISVTVPMVERVLQRCTKLRFLDCVHCEIPSMYLLEWSVSYVNVTICNADKFPRGGFPWDNARRNRPMN
ncbi:AGAP000471-PA-like protein [Anopheles sinensis]|uniref:AGAP000471-PA-like protein n=1 Tax=Anopheles sinensis TaxID=74873 RepID=A0A084VLT6_ANOSI|nr:AGAP000471-PA-like protein [Anopheles sinensis]